MGYHVYILDNQKGRFYVGHTDNLDRRLKRHNRPEEQKDLRKHTHKHGPWKMVWSEEHLSRSSAMKREKQIKSWKSARTIRERLLAQR